MKRKILPVLVLLITAMSLSSCKVSKHYVQNIVKKATIENPKNKRVFISTSDKIHVDNFKKTFKKNYKTENDFIVSFIGDFSKKLNTSNVYAEIVNSDLTDKAESIHQIDADLEIHFAGFEITNRVEYRSTPAAAGPNGFGGMQHNTVEYCVINTKVIIYDITNQGRAQVLEFVSIGEKAVGLFNYTKTFLEAKSLAIEHTINYLKTGKVVY